MKIFVQRRHALMVEDGAFSHKIGYFRNILEILNLEGHPNCITDSRVTAIFLNVLIVPLGGVASRRVCSCSLCKRLVYLNGSKLFFGIMPRLINKSFRAL